MDEPARVLNVRGIAPARPARIPEPLVPHRRVLDPTTGFVVTTSDAYGEIISSPGAYFSVPMKTAPSVRTLTVEEVQEPKRVAPTPIPKEVTHYSLLTGVKVSGPAAYGEIIRSTGAHTTTPLKSVPGGTRPQ